MSSRTLRLGTRASLLARTQSEQVAAAVRDKLSVEVELVEITTEGDTNRAPLASLGGTGVFISALRDALLADRVDLVVHSLKDLPTAPHPEIALAAVPPRQDPRDVLVARDGLTLGELPPSAVIGTGSPRRAAQLHALGLGVEIREIRGNVDSRLAKVADGEVDAVILARAGLARLDRADEATETLDPLQMLPAPGQGALAIECRAVDRELIDALAALDDEHTRAAVTAERAVLEVLEGGCSAPIASLADVVEADLDEAGLPTFELWVRAIALSLDGALSVRRSLTGSLGDAYGVGVRLAEQMLEDGAADLMGDTGRQDA